MTTDRSPSGGVGPTWAQSASLGIGELAPTDPPPRAAVVASLASALSRAVASGDHVAARVVHEAIGRLLVVPAASGDGGVVDHCGTPRNDEL
ncbi:hypothetical protein WME91_33915 [Sorangium sp. So ce269]